MGIVNWTDLLQYVFKIETESDTYWQGEEGLKRAQDRLNSFFTANKCLPKFRDQPFHGMRNAIKKHYWDKLGIQTWDDLAFKTVGIVPHHIIKRNLTFDSIKLELIRFYDQHQRLPVSSEFPYVLTVINTKKLNQFGIHSWNDLLQSIFNKTNRPSIPKIHAKKPINFDSIRLELITFYEQYQQLPRVKDFQYLHGVIQKGKCAQFGIQSWNDLLQNIFSRTNKEHKKICTFKGLKQAQQELLEFHDRFQRIPTAKDRHMSRISSAIYRKLWINWGIFTWKDLIRKTFTEIEY